MAAVISWRLAGMVYLSYLEISEDAGGNHLGHISKLSLYLERVADLGHGTIGG